MNKNTEKTKKNTHETQQKSLTTKEFLDSYPNKKTQANYILAIKHFLSTTKHQNPEQYLKELSAKNRNYYLDLKIYGQKLSKTYAPTTAALYLRCVCLWLEECGFTLTKRERQRLNAQLPPVKPRTCEIELKRKTLRLIYKSLPTPLGTLLLVLLASGMRLGETLQLKKSDVNWEEDRIEISIPAEITKTKIGRTTYLTDEAANSLMTYILSRDDSDEHLFPITAESAQYHLRKTVKQLGISYTIGGKRYSIHWHMTRKWFISRFSLVANKDVAEHIAGHEGYLTVSYRRYTKKQIIKEYAKAEKKLSILKDRE